MGSICRAQAQNWKQWTQNGTQAVPSEHQEMLFHHDPDWALAQVTQRCCGVSLLWDNQKPSGHGSGQTALGHPAWAGDWNTTSRDSFSPQAPCDFGKEKFRTSSIKLLQFTSLSQLPWRPPLHLCKVTSPHNQSRLRGLVRTFTGGSSAKVQWVPQLPDLVILVLLASWQFYISKHFVPSLSRTETLSLQQSAELHMHRDFSLHPLLPHYHSITERGTSLSNSNFFISSLSSYREI